MKQELNEMQVRSALSAIAGTEPNGIIIAATEVKASDAAVGAAFGAIGSAIHKAVSSRPDFHIIHRTAMGLYFLPVYNKKSEYVLVPAENFFIPHAQIAQMTVVRGLFGGMRIDIKLQNGQTFQFNGNQKIKAVPFQAENFPKFYAFYEEQSRKKQRNNKVLVGVLAAIFVLLIGFIVFVPDAEPVDDASPAVGDSVYAMETHLIADTVSLEVPKDFQPMTAEEIAEYDPEDGIIAGFAPVADDVCVLVSRVATDWTDEDLASAYEQEKPEQDETYTVELTTSSNGVCMLVTKETVPVQNTTVYAATAYFVADGYLYQVMYNCAGSAAEKWGDADSAVIGSIQLPNLTETKVYIVPTEAE
ncbi:MAG: hypothetical protein ACI4LB_09380 [Candidatus Fimenecus sp.]